MSSAAQYPAVLGYSGVVFLFFFFHLSTQGCFRIGQYPSKFITTLRTSAWNFTLGNRYTNSEKQNLEVLSFPIHQG